MRLVNVNLTVGVFMCLFQSFINQSYLSKISARSSKQVQVSQSLGGNLKEKKTSNLLFYR